MWDDVQLLRRLTGYLWLLCTVTMVITAGRYVLHRPEFALKTVALTKPLQHVSSEVLARVVHEQIQGNFFTVNLTRTRLMLEQVPWVRKVSVRRKFPWALEVELEEQQVVATWNQSELVNTYGEVFAGQTSQELPHFYGQPGSSLQVMQMYAELSSTLLPLSQSLTQIYLTPRFAWQVRLSDGMVLELGHEQMQQRLARFVAVYPYSLAKWSAANQRVDLRYQNGFAVELHGGEIESPSSDLDNSV